MTTQSTQQALIVAPTRTAYVAVCRKLGLSPVAAIHVTNMNKLRGWTQCRVISTMSLADWKHMDVVQLQLAAGDGGNLGDIEYVSL